jgi:hypothetical protein
VVDEDRELLKGMGVYRAIKNVEQGAATTVWAAVSPYFNKAEHGGQYLADVGVSDQFAPYAFDKEAEEKLWDISCKAVGVAA